MSFVVEIPENSCRWSIGLDFKNSHGGWGSGRGQLDEEITQWSHGSSCLMKASEISETFKTGLGRWVTAPWSGERHGPKHGHTEIHGPYCEPDAYLSTFLCLCFVGIKERTNCSYLSLQLLKPYPASSVQVHKRLSMRPFICVAIGQQRTGPGMKICLYECYLHSQQFA